MRGVYTVNGVNLTLANQAVTLVFINPGTTASFRVLRGWATQAGVTSSVQQRIQWNTQVSAFPTVTSATPAKSVLLDGAAQITGGAAGAAGTAGVNASAEGAGAKTVIIPDTFSVLNGYLWTPTPDEQLMMSASSASGLGLHLPAAAGTLSGWNTGVTYAEL
jgi:hypothetical protein